MSNSPPSLWQPAAKRRARSRASSGSGRAVGRRLGKRTPAGRSSGKREVYRIRARGRASVHGARRSATIAPMTPRRSSCPDIPPEQAGQRLDQALAAPAAALFALPTQGLDRVRRDPRRWRGAAPARRVFGGEAVCWLRTLQEETRAAPQAIPLAIVHEDKHLFVIDKPAGLVVHPGAGNPDRHPAERAAGARPDSSPRAARRHRAPPRQGHQRPAGGGAHAARRTRRWSRRSGARGRTASTWRCAAARMTGGGTIDAAHRPAPTDRVAHGRARRRPRGRHALPRRASASARTRCCACSSRPAARTRSACTSRTSGYPLVGDPVYGGRLTPAAGRGARRCGRRCAPSTARRCMRRGCEFEHPVSGRPLECVERRCRRTFAACSRCWRADERRRMTRDAPSAGSQPDWPAPARVRALFDAARRRRERGRRTRRSTSAAHVGDDPAAVAANRAACARRAHLPAEPLWLEQVHGVEVVRHGRRCRAGAARDAAVALASRARVCAVLTADCLPVLLARPAADTRVGAHAGWRGLAGRRARGHRRRARRAAGRAACLARARDRAARLRGRAGGARGVPRAGVRRPRAPASVPQRARPLAGRPVRRSPRPRLRGAGVGDGARRRALHPSQDATALLLAPPRRHAPAAWRPWRWLGSTRVLRSIAASHRCRRRSA